MEEKRSIKISLKTYLISMFLMLLVIGILLGYILHTGENINKSIMEKSEAEKIASEIATEDEENNNAIATENEVADNTVIENSSETDETTVVDENKKEDLEFSDEEVKVALENYLDIFVGHGGPDGVLNSLDLMSYSDMQNYELDEDNYRRTDILYSEFEKKIEEYITLEHFEDLNNNGKFVSPEFKNIDGNVAYFDSGWTGTEYEVEKVSLKGDNSDTRYTAEIITILGEYEEEKNAIEFEIQNDNGKCLISNCYFE